MIFVVVVLCRYNGLEGYQKWSSHPISGKILAYYLLVYANPSACLHAYANAVYYVIYVII